MVSEHPSQKYKKLEVSIQEEATIEENQPSLKKFIQLPPARK